MARNKKGNLSKNPNGSNYCGPSALTVLTGRTYESVEKTILKYRRSKRRVGGNTKKVAGMWNPEMSAVMILLGYKMTGFRYYHPSILRDYRDLTLRQYMRKTHGKRGKLWLLVQTTSHYLVVRGNRVWDSGMNGVTISKANYKRGILKRIWVVERLTKSERKAEDARHKRDVKRWKEARKKEREAKRRWDAKRKKVKVSVWSEPIWTDVFNLKKGG